MRDKSITSLEVTCHERHVDFQPDDWRTLPQPAHWTCTFCEKPVWTLTSEGRTRCPLLHVYDTVKCSGCGRVWRGLDFADLFL